MKNGLQSLGKSLLYLLLFLGIHTITYVAFAVAFTVQLLSGSPDPQAAIHSGVILNQFMTVYDNNLTLMTLIANFAVLLVIVLVFALRKKPLLPSIDFKPLKWPSVLGCVLFAVGLAGILSMAVDLVPFSEELRTSFFREHNSLREGNPLISIISVVFMGPLTEEIVFRGLMYTRLRKGLPRAAAVIISALIFGLVHGEAIWGFVGFTGALALIWILESTGSLKGCILVHMVNNAISQLTAGVREMSSWQIICLAVAYGLCFIAGFLWLIRLSKNPAAEPAAAEV